MRVTGTSSAQTAGCGHTEIQQGLPVKQDYRLQRVAGVTQQGYWLQRITCYRVLPVPECCWFRSIAGYTCYRELPVPECYRLQRIDGDKLVGQEVF